MTAKLDSALYSIRKHLESVGAHKDYIDHCDTIAAEVALLTAQPSDSLDAARYRKALEEIATMPVGQAHMDMNSKVGQAKTAYRYQLVARAALQPSGEGVGDGTR